MIQSMQKKVLVGVGVAVILAGIILWWWQAQNAQDAVPSLGNQAPAAGTSLGENLLEKAQNPLADKLPVVNPGAGVNPLEGSYKNPFE